MTYAFNAANPSNSSGPAGPPVRNPAHTPELMLDEVRMQANICRMQARLSAAQVIARPHVKTAKCLPIMS